MPDAAERTPSTMHDMVTAETMCHQCGVGIADDAPAVRAYARVVVAPESVDTPDLRGDMAVFHEACAPDWGDPDWISRAEGALHTLR